jgi:UDP-N-acetyl-D-mannosaminuronic acid dehydrogenase
MCKLVENSFRDVNIAFANELSMICDQFDINVWELIALANRHPRVNILQPGAGVGGHCIAVDPWFLVSASPDGAKLIHQARLVNDSKPGWVVSKVESAVLDNLRVAKNKQLEDIKIACMGLAFKPDIDDLRESPALAIVKTIASKFPGQIMVVEPNINALPDGLSCVEMLGIDEALSLADIVVVLVRHKEFAQILGTINSNQTVIDAVGV